MGPQQAASGVPALCTAGPAMGVPPAAAMADPPARLDTTWGICCWTGPGEGKGRKPLVALVMLKVADAGEPPNGVVLGRRLAC